MITGEDPIVGQALELLVPRLAVDPDEVLAGARAGAARLRAGRRRRQTAAALAFAALLLLAGGAFAAKKLDLLPFLHTHDPNTARFSVAPSRTYRGAAPPALTCPGSRTGPFVCQVTSRPAAGNRTYEFAMRTNRVPLLTRNSLLAALARAQRNGADPAQVARFEADLGDVGDDFIRALAIVARIETVGGVGASTGPTGTERVPPTGIPAWIACREITPATVRCRPLAALAGVAGGTPLYFLRPSEDWPEVSAPSAQMLDVERLFGVLLGRKPTAAEMRFFVDFATVAVTTGGASAPKVQRTKP